MIPYADPRFSNVHDAPIPDQFGVVMFCSQLWAAIAATGPAPDNPIASSLQAQAAEALKQMPMALELFQLRAIEVATSRLASYRRLTAAAPPAMAIDHRELAADLAGQLQTVLSVLALKHQGVEAALALYDLAVTGSAHAEDPATHG